MPKTQTPHVKPGQGTPGRPRKHQNNPDATAYGRELKAIREAMGWTQKEMATHLGLRAWETISRYENGQMIVSEPIIRLARSLRRRDRSTERLVLATETPKERETTT